MHSSSTGNYRYSLRISKHRKTLLIHSLKTFVMKQNMGIIDRVFRISVAAFLGILYFGGYITGLTGIIAVIIATVFLLTSIAGNCPLYALFGVSTCKNNNRAR